MSGSDFVIAGGGQVGELIRNKRDWHTSRLGPPDSWPQSLRTALSIVLSSRFPMIIFWGEHLSVLYNDAYIPIFAGKHPDVLGKTGFEAWGEVWDVIAPMFKRVRAGEATWSEDQLLLLERRGFVEECYFTWSYSPIRDERGEVGGVFTAITETTPRVFAERRLSTLRALSEHIAETQTPARACVEAMATLAQNPKDVPNAAIYLLEPGGAACRRVANHNMGERAAPEFIELQDAQRWPFGAVAESGRPKHLRVLPETIGPLPAGVWGEPTTSALVLPIAKGGQHVPFGFLVVGLSPRLALDEAYASFFALASQHIAAAIANATAYEEERARLEGLAELDRAKTAFFSNVSHEFRTPLTLMLGPLEDALTSGEHALQGENLQTAHRNALRLQRLVNALLDFSRIEAGRVQASFEQTDLGTFTAELGSVFRSAIERAGLRYTLDAKPLDAPVYVDREMWEKIVLNLLSNALKFTFQGEIALRVAREGETIVLSVDDTGTGVPAAELPHLFERFHRVRGARARTHEGSGIGLALVSELVKLHGGEIRAESQEGKGTRFEVRIPLGRAHLPAERVVQAPAPASVSRAGLPFVQEALRWLPEAGNAAVPGDAESLERLGPSERSAASAQRILVADDNADMREYVARLLSTRWHVRTVSDGAAALQQIQRDPPDLVISDVMMPGMDGFELLRALRGDPATRTLPVILLSARAGEESTTEGLHAGANDYLVKPFSARELLARVSSQLTIAAIRREAENEREAQQSVLRTLFRDAPAAITLLRGPELLIEFANPLAVSGWQRASVEKVLGRPLLEVLPELAGQGFDDLLHRVMRSGETFFASERPATFKRDGREVTVYFNFAYVPTRNAGGQVDGVSVYANDVTAQVTARERAELGAQVGRAFVDRQPITTQLQLCADALVKLGPALVRIWTYDATHDLLAFRAGAGSSPPTEADPRAAQTVARSGKPQLTRDTAAFGVPVDWATQQGIVACGGYPLVVRDQLVGVLELYGKTDFPADALYAVAAVADQIALGIDRDASERFRELFIGMLGHDLRNPLNAVLMATHLVAGKAADSQKKALARIENSARRMERMIDQVLDFTRARSGGGIPLARTAADLRAICEQVVEELTTAHPERRVSFAASGELHGAWDADRMAQVFSNLVGNALSYSPPGSTVSVTLGASEQEVVLEVHNTGEPIPPELVPTLFDPFRRAGTAKATSTRGLGLGLFISHQIVAAHGGSISVESSASAGTSFLVKLPRSGVPA
jgi:signal transduction histidine kinase/CheY-like chemotaxis protein